MPRLLWRSYGGGAVYFERGTSVGSMSARPSFVSRRMSGKANSAGTSSRQLRAGGLQGYLTSKKMHSLRTHAQSPGGVLEGAFFSWSRYPCTATRRAFTWKGVEAERTVSALCPPRARLSKGPRLWTSELRAQGFSQFERIFAWA